MTHPIGKHISKEQDHELDYWLNKHDFKKSKDNRKSLCSLIDTAKSELDMDSSKHLEHTELNNYYEENKEQWEDKFEKK
ncbi:hypothetical protein K3R08_004407 [Escherichia albertii]|nr:hypothetical protein [Escherichia albertii]